MVSGREMALKILYETEQKDGYFNIIFQNRMKDSGLPRGERALAKELASGVMQRKITLDYVIRSFSSVRLKKISPYILQILRLGMYQLYYMDKIPARAAVDESVKLAKKYGHSASAGFVNAILHRAAREAGPPLPARGESEVRCLSVKHSHPEELTQWYLEQFGAERAERLLEENNKRPPLSLRVNRLKISRAELIEILAAEGICTTPSKLADSGLLAERGANPEGTRAWRTGLFSIQGQSSQAAALALAPKPGETVLDLCCAPGGKTAHLAELMDNKGRILASDLYAHRLGAVRDNARRLGIGIIETAQMDAAEEKREYVRLADKILLDVPCSGLGIIRRKPDIRYKKDLTNFKEIIEIQKKILNNCAKYLKIEGELVYSTCTLNPEENMGVVRAFLAEHPEFTLMAAESPHMGETLRKELERGYTTLYPDVHGSDGFFICKLKRRG